MNAERLQFSEFKNASLLNFALRTDRERMTAALEKVKKTLGKSYRLEDGAETTATDVGDRFHTSLNPARPEEIVGRVQFADMAETETALQKVYEASHSWKKTSVFERARLLDRLGDWLEAQRDELSALMVFEVGKDWRSADADTCEAIDFCRYYAREIIRVSQPKLTQQVEGETNHLSYHPIGVCAVIAPWNFPLAILTGMATAALVSGNTCILKPAEQSSVIAAKLAQGLKAAGFPEGSFYFLPGVGEDIGPKLVSDERVDIIAFTGSAAVGLQIIESAARKPGPNQRGVKRVVCEMGGKNALIVDEDADLDEAVVGCLHSAFGFQGQKCSALSRLLVHSNVYKSFCDRFVEAVASLNIGAPDNPDNQIGPVIDEDSQKRILQTIQEASSRLKTLYKAKGVPSPGYFVPPAIFELSGRNDPLFQNEVFGPVVAVKKVESLDEAIEDANSTRFALTGGIYSRNPSSIDEVKSRLEVGNLYINRGITGAIVERQPFGGFKLSGIGSKAGGPDYLLQFLEPRTMTENTVRRGFAAES